MFGKKQHGDLKKSYQKVLDPKKDTFTRLKHLRVLLDNYDVLEAKKFFEVNYSNIYYIFYDVFVNLEAELKRSNKSYRDELDGVLFIFEKILVLLPELIHKRWQFHSIGRILSKLLHTGNALKLRREGMRLFLIWYQILQENATKTCHVMFANLVPGLGDGGDGAYDGDTLTRSTATAVVNEGKIGSVDLLPLLPPQLGEKTPDNITKCLLDSLVLFMVSEITKVEWENKQMQEFSFNFLFNYFKQYYLLKIFPDFSYQRSIYDLSLDLPEMKRENSAETTRNNELGEYQEVIIKWLTLYTHSSKSKDQTSVHEDFMRDQADGESSAGMDGAMPGGSISTLSTASTSTVYTDGTSLSTADDRSTPGYEIVKASLFSTRENINLVHELYRQAFYFSFRHSSAMRKVIAVYRDWLQSDERPIFMQDPPKDSPPPSCNDVIVSEASSVPSKENDDLGPLFPSQTRWYTTLDLRIDPDRNHASSSAAARTSSIRLRNNSYLGAVGSLELLNARRSATLREAPPSQCLENGIQRSVRVFVTHVSSVFFHRTELLNHQVDMCKRVLNIYRHVVMNLHMERQTWEQLLLVLLKITSTVLKYNPPSDRDSCLGGRLASALFQTLIVTWIKANLNVFISAELWDQFLSVLASLTQWEELIKEWAKTIETLTRLLARNVYNLDVYDLPLDRLSEQKEKRRRAKSSTGPLGDRTRSSTVNLTQNDVMARASRIGPRDDSRTARNDLNKNEVAASTTSDRPVYSDSFILQRFDPAVGSDSLSESISFDECSPGALESFPSRLGPGEYRSGWSESERTRSLSGSPGDVASTKLDRTRSSSDSNLHQYNMTGTGHEVVVSDHDRDSSRGTVLGLDDARHVIGDASFDDQLGDVLGDHPLTDDQDIRSMTESLTSTASYVSVDSNLHITSSLDTTLVDAGTTESDGKSHDDLNESCDRTLLNNQIDVADASSHDVLLRDDRVRDHSSDSSSPARSSLIDDRSLLDDRSSLIDDRSSLIDDRSSLADVVELNQTCKYSPTPDRESIHIDSVVDEGDVMSESVHCLETDGECRSVLAGGNVPGWTPDVCVVLWRRMLGALGDINKILDPVIHASVYDYLCELVESLIKIRDNLAVTMDNQSTPTTPELLPPIMLIAPWLFKALTMSDVYKRGKLLAYRLLCTITLRRHDVGIAPDHVAQFYSIVHDGLTSRDQDVVNTLLRYCGATFFSTAPAGNTLLMLDFIDAASRTVSASELLGTPRTEAMSVLGALVCFPHLHDQLTVLQPNTGDLIKMSRAEFKDHLIGFLLKSGKKEPAGLARCIALSSLGLYLYHELKHTTMHSKVAEAISTLTMTLRFNNKLVAQVACDVLYLLCDHIHIILQTMPQVPGKIIQSISATISSGLPTTDSPQDTAEERFLCSLMFCLLEWSMRVPNQLMMDTDNGGQRPLIYTVFKVLNQAVSGCNSANSTISRSTLTLSDLQHQDYDLENVKETQSCPTSPWGGADSVVIEEELDAAVQAEYSGHVVKTAARTVLNHLVNHFGHFPRGGGAARFNSSVQEFHDVPDLTLDELKPEIFDMPNVQFFVLNNSVLISLIELPAWRDVPGGGMTAGLTTSATIARLVIRDVSGKYCWDSAILYRPPRCDHSPSDLQDYLSANLGDGDDLSISERIAESFSFLKETQHDELNKLLHYIGTTSKECLLRPGVPLNIPGPPVDGITAEAEREMCQSVLVQKQEEADYVASHSNDHGVVANEELAMVIEDPVSPFQLCRMLLVQLGFLSWEKRASFDLLKKSDRLLRELKNIDNRHCRETHKVAVFYVALGQEDKNSILSNSSGSKAYEDFVSGLGWEVDLENHCGYRGGLPLDKSCGDTTPYYATSTLEVLYHVSTRMPGQTEEDRHRKLRHLGNDEVMVVWSEHHRDYRRGIVPTEFGDVLIIIYPLQNGLFRLQIDKKSEVPYFGPLFDGAIVDEKILSGLVRAAAINAGRVKRSLMPMYRPFYQERSRYLESIVSKHKQHSMFEEFAEEVFAPILDPDNALPGTPVQDVPFLLNAGPSLFNGGDTRTDRISPRAKHGSKESESQTFNYPPSIVQQAGAGAHGASGADKSMGRRLSFRNVRRLSLRTSSQSLHAASQAQLHQLSDSSSPESPTKNRAR